MKKVNLVACAVIASLLCSCGQNKTHGHVLLSSNENEAVCQTECSKSYLKAQNKCSLDFPDDYPLETACTNNLKHGYDKCLGKCMGNI